MIMKNYILCGVFFLGTVICYSQDSQVKYFKSVAQADSEYVKENFRSAVDLYERTFSENNNMGMVRDRIKAACCYSMLKSYDSAFFHLNRIFKYGHYYDFDKLLAERKFDNLYHDPRWQELITAMKKETERIIELMNQNQSPDN